MPEIDRRPASSLSEPTWWSQRTPLEKIGAVGLVAVGGLVAAAVLFPSAAATVAGGAFAATGGLLLKKGFGK